MCTYCEGVGERLNRPLKRNSNQELLKGTPRCPAGQGFGDRQGQAAPPSWLPRAARSPQRPASTPAGMAAVPPGTISLRQRVRVEPSNLAVCGQDLCEHGHGGEPHCVQAKLRLWESCPGRGEVGQSHGARGTAGAVSTQR